MRETKHIISNEKAKVVLPTTQALIEEIGQTISVSKALVWHPTENKLSLANTLNQDTLEALEGTGANPTSINRFVTNDTLNEVAQQIQTYIDTMTVQDIQLSFTGSTLQLDFYTYQNALLGSHQVEIKGVLTAPILALSTHGFIEYPTLYAATEAQESIIYINSPVHLVTENIYISVETTIYGQCAALNLSGADFIITAPVEFHDCVIDGTNTTSFINCSAKFFNSTITNYETNQVTFKMYAGSKSTNGIGNALGNSVVYMYTDAKFDSSNTNWLRYDKTIAYTLLPNDIENALLTNPSTPTDINYFTTLSDVNTAVQSVQEYVDTMTVQDMNLTLIGNDLTLDYYTYQNALIGSRTVTIPAGSAGGGLDYKNSIDIPAGGVNVPGAYNRFVIRNPQHNKVYTVSAQYAALLFIQAGAAVGDTIALYYNTPFNPNISLAVINQVSNFGETTFYNDNICNDSSAADTLYPGDGLLMKWDGSYWKTIEFLTRQQTTVKNFFTDSSINNLQAGIANLQNQLDNFQGGVTPLDSNYYAYNSDGNIIGFETIRQAIENGYYTVHLGKRDVIEQDDFDYSGDSNRIVIYGNGGVLQFSAKNQAAFSNFEVHDTRVINANDIQTLRITGVNYGDLTVSLFNSSIENAIFDNVIVHAFAGSSLNVCDGDYNNSYGYPTTVNLYDNATCVNGVNFTIISAGSGGNYLQTTGGVVTGDVYIGDGTQSTDVRLRFGNIYSGTVDYSLLSTGDFRVEDSNGNRVISGNSEAIYFCYNSENYVYTDGFYTNRNVYWRSSDNANETRASQSNDEFQFASNTGAYNWFSNASGKVFELKESGNTSKRNFIITDTNSNQDTAWNNAGVGSNILVTRRKMEEAVAAAPRYRGTFAFSTNYKAGDVVVYQSKYYQCITSFTSGFSFVESNWTIQPGWGAFIGAPANFNVIEGFNNLSININNGSGNRFGAFSQNLTLNGTCSGNNFGNTNRDSTFTGMSDSTFGNLNRYHTIGSSNNFLRFGNGCSYIVTGTGCTKLTVGDLCQYVTFGDGCSNVTVLSTQGTAVSPFVIPAYTSNVIYEDGVTLPRTTKPYLVDSDLRINVQYGAPYSSGQLTGATPAGSSIGQTFYDSNYVYTCLPNSNYTALVWVRTVKG